MRKDIGIVVLKRKKMAHKILAENDKAYLVQFKNETLPNPYWIRKGKPISERLKKILEDNLMIKAEALAIRFHDKYEELAPQFGYETREETRQFDKNSKNGKLMIAVCASLLEGGIK